MSRVGAAPGGLRPVTPRPVKRTLGPSATPGTDAMRAKSRLGEPRGMVNSNSDDSIKGYLSSGGNEYIGGGQVDQGLDLAGEAEEVLGESEAVLVTVR